MTTPAFPLKADAGTTTKWGYGVTYLDGSDVIERFVVDGLTQAHAEYRASVKEERSIVVEGPHKGKRVRVVYGPVFSHEVSRSAWAEVAK